MVTNSHSKSIPGSITLLVILLGVILVALHTRAIMWVRNENSFMVASFTIKREFSVSNINTLVLSRLNFQKDVTAPEEVIITNFEDQVRSQVEFICSEIYPDIDANYVLAIIYHESRFDPTVINSKSGATGLMQILPKWHTVRAQKLGVELTDPYGNILTGCDILNEVYQQSKSMSYTLNVYAGGYTYANKYIESKSPFEKELDEILESGVLYSVGGDE